MRVFILSLLAVSSVNSHAIHYPQHNQLLAYSPARGEFPVYNDVAQGYLRYYDSNGAEQQLGYSYPEPLYGVRRFSYISGSNGNQLLRTGEPGFNAASYYQLQDNAEIIKAREEHFRRWCEQRYQALKAEMEKLRAEGLKPSSDMMAQMRPLEKIISSTTYTAIGESPEIKRIRDEHLRIWNEARLKVLQQEAEHLRFHHPQESSNELKTSFSGSTSDVNAIIGETAEQKKAREEHLRIYNEQVQRVKQLETERLQQIGSKGESEILGTKDQYNQYQQGSGFELKSSLQQGQQQLQFQQSGQVMDTPEVIRAREEHLRLVNEAKLRAQADGTYNKAEVSGTKDQFNQFQQGSSFDLKSGLQQGQQQLQFQQSGQVMETPEVIRAREEHLRLVNEAKLRAQADGTYNKAEVSGTKDQYNQFQSGISFELKSGLPQGQQQLQFQQSGQVMETPEVIRAREEHLRLVNEAKIRAQTEGTYNTNDDGSYKPEKIEASPVLKFVPSVQQPIQPIQNIAILQTTQPTQQAFVQQQESTYLKTGSIDFSQQQAQPTPVQDTPEVIRAREEHLRLVNEAKLRAQADGTYKDQFNQLQSGISFELKSGLQQGQQPLQFQQSGQVMETPEVIRAREEHLRLVNEAKLKAGQQTGTFNNIQQTEKFETYAAKDDVTAERLLEAERMREEEKMREMERLRELERRKEEERMLETERLRLKKEEEERMEKERLGSTIKSAAQGFESSSSSGSASSFSSGSTSGSVTGTGFVLSSQYQNNPFLLRFAAQPGTTTYIVGEQQAAIGTKPNLFYLPAKSDNTGAIQQQNPFLLRGTQALGSQQQTAFKPFLSSEKISTYSSSSGSLSGGSSSSIKFDYGTGSELEKATRDHFRAHELALEQLRLANLKNPQGKDC